MSIVCGAIVPHPTALVSGKEEKVKAAFEHIRQGFQTIRQKILACSPQTLVFISPHGSCYTDAFAIKREPMLKGFIVGEGISVEVPCDQNLVNQILKEANTLGVPALALEKNDSLIEISVDLDHGVLIPLTLLQKEPYIPLLSISICDLGIFEHYRLGLTIRKASESLDRKIAIIASGSLSHVDIENPDDILRARSFDQKIIKALNDGDFRQIVELDSPQVEDIEGCGFLPLMILAGSFDGYRTSTEIVTYDSPYGDGYLTAIIYPGQKDKRMRLLEEFHYMHKTQLDKRRAQESLPVSIARKAVETYVKEGKIIKPPTNLPSYLRKPAAVFVSLKKGKTLRGCIGTTTPTTESAAEEIIQNAIHSATRDPRFFPVESSELPYLVYSVDILGEMEQVVDTSQLDHKKYGVYVMCGSRCGLLLPDIDGVDSVEQQLSIAKQKGGIADDEPAQVFRFKVTRYR